MTKLSSNIPPHMNHVFTTWESITEADRTPDVLLDSLILEAERDLQRQQAQDNSHEESI
jgi:hypothetical protein